MLVMAMDGHLNKKASKIDDFHAKTLKQLLN